VKAGQKTSLSFLEQKQFQTWKDYYFQYQFQLAQQYYIPLLQTWGLDIQDTSVLDIGCGNGGFSSAFVAAGGRCTGVEIRTVPWDMVGGNPRFLVQDITATDAPEVLNAPFDIIILRDVIEHITIPLKSHFLRAIHRLIHSRSRILVTFPPFYSPFGLHQQTLLKSKLRKVPFLGWIPGFILNPVLAISGEKLPDIQEVRSIRQCRMTIGAFKKLIQSTGYTILKEKYFHIRPSHEIRYGWKTRESAFGNFPLLREIVNLGTVYLLEKSD